MDFLSNFSERLSDLMFEAKLTTDQLGAKIGVSGSIVRRWRAKKLVISLSRALAVAEYFNCSLDFLFGRSETLIDFIPKPTIPFYDRLREIMESKNISRYRVCLDLKKGHGHFDNWKSGSDPDMSTVYEFAVYFDVTIDFLVGRE